MKTDSGNSEFVCNHDEIPDHGARLIERDGKIASIIRCGDKFSAIEERCPHRAGPLSEGTIIDGKVRCPWHGSEFHLATGAVCRGPAKRAITLHTVIERGTEIWLDWNPSAPT